ncbi:MAG: RluA family pseudouridine synthase [Oscillospiraceae bacterium]|nr:RluA family pseudouridine synthase [Oscillospiraceae bacterium]
MKSFTINAADDGTRLNRFLMKCAPKLPASLIYKYLREKKIKCNGKRCEASARLAAGDVLTLYIDDAFFACKKKLPAFLRAAGELKVLYEDDALALLDKPAGVLCHSDESTFCDTMVDRFLRYLFEKDEFSPDAAVGFTPALCNRLDRGTQGIVIAAKTAAALRELNAMIRRDLLVKKYLCVCTGEPPRDGVYNAWHSKDETKNKVRVAAASFPGAKSIRTGFRLVERRGALSLLEVTLYTGRTHQIRAHLTFLGAPILGDLKYGNATMNKKYGLSRQALAACSLEFALPADYDGGLTYLAGRRFSLEDVWFKAQFFPDTAIQ